jgi:RHS repeat-associated protein
VAADAVKFVANDAEELLYVHTDHLGSPRKITDAGRAIVWDAVFTPFGEEDSIAGSETANWRLPGQYHDAEAALSYNYRRTYDPALGRYLQSDPIGIDGGLNTYAYVNGNPIGNIDLAGTYVEASRNGNNINLNFPAIFSGNGATQSTIYEYTNAIESAWTNTFGNYTVTLEVTTPPPGTPQGQYNEIVISSLAGNACGGRPCADVGGTWMNIPPLSQSLPSLTLQYNLWAAGHEAGHLMGLTDRYDPTTGLPLPNYTTNIMGAFRGTPSSQDISDILLWLISLSYAGDQDPAPPQSPLDDLDLPKPIFVRCEIHY